MAFARLRSLWRNLRYRDRVERDLDDEMTATLDLLIDEKITAGLDPLEAKRRARIELEGIEPLKERVRDVQAGIWLDSVMRDTKYALRHFQRSPGFVLTAVLTLALGIGANTAIFSVLHALQIERLAIPDPDGLYSLASYNELGGKRYIPMPTVIDLNQAGPFIEACGYNGGGIVPVEANGTPTQAVVAFVSGRCFSTFGVTPVLGRVLIDDDAPIMSPGRKVVLISDRLWNIVFGRNPAAIGKVIKVEGAEVTVVGVLPAGFRGIHADTGIDLFAPPDTIIPATPGRRPVAQEVLGRLKPGVTSAQASSQLEAMWPALLQAARESTRDAGEGSDLLGSRIRLEPMGRGLSPVRDNYSQAIALIFGLTTLLLLLACVNLGGLLLTRLTARSAELGVRLALGGSRARIAQQMLVESLVLSGAGTLVAIPIAFAFVAPISAFLDPGFAGWERSFSPNLRVLAVTAAVGVIVGLLLTVLPTFLAMRGQQTVRFTWDRTMTGAAGRWTRGLMITQVAMSVVLLIGAALLTRSLFAIQHTDPGVRIGGILNAKLVSLPGGLRGLDSDTYYPELAGKLAAIPGVSEVGYSRVFPRRLSNITTEIGFVGEAFGGARASLDSVSGNFFDLVGIRLLTGRTFTPADHRKAPRVGVVSESLARQLATDGHVVDRHIRFGTNRDMQDILIVGVVSNATQGDLKNTTQPVLYSSAFQVVFNSPNLLFRIAGDQAQIAGAIRRIVLEHGREYVFETNSLEALFARGPVRERLSASVAGVIGTLAVLLAVIGIQGVLAYSVSCRTREIGVRVAIGADPGTVARAVIREGCTLTALGIAIGLPAAYFASRGLRSMLFGISETDAWTYSAAALFFIVLGGLAGFFPARRAAAVDPVIAMRSE